MSTLLSTKNLQKSYDKELIIKGIDFSMEEGDFISLLGASGSGKSTFLHLLASLEKPDEGEIVLKNKNYSKLTKNQLAKMRNEEIGFVYQFHHLLPDFTLEENIIIPAMIGGQDSKTAKDYAHFLMEFMGIENLGNRKPQQVSGGEQQRAAIARALINKPSLLLADEPTGNLDEDNTQKVQELFEKLNNELNQSILMATHDQQLARAARETQKMVEGKLKKE